ncbi:hypothetical protein [Paenibacillus roseipurpureus]|uniref:DarT domain-containing protein n=1 Tax=Paenibacillus roseopurpureus TaxID=2918901 RepID=A0AA96LSH6_9BACL|nr:hypothetical protein [Paenibacillus sp. MBLB1832]WNR45103.1 hypothetical protein MJB10_02835 [Paenibacillus sp. MBLB1832]
MELDRKLVLEKLRDKGITHLYHANTVATACTFLRQGGLLSRGAVEARGLYQTPQNSDDIDKKFNVWNDIFFDSIDLHTFFSRQNHYGPVLFKFNIDVLSYDQLPPIWVTKDNPTRWKKGENNYFLTIEDFESEYSLGKYREMITLRNTTEVLPFIPYLEEIILDDPKLMIKSDDTIFLNAAADALRKELNESGFDYSHVTRKYRDCSSNFCYCLSNYKGQVGIQKLKDKFLI